MVAFRHLEEIMDSKTADKFMVRMPDGVRDWLAEQAARNASSMNSEVVRAIRERMDRVSASEAKRQMTARRAT